MQRLRRLARERAARQEAGVFVLEGAKIVEEARRAGANIESVFLDREHASTDECRLAESCASDGAELVDVQAGVLGRVLDTVAPQPIAATVARVDRPIERIDRPRLVLVLAGVSDPGNAGTLIRAAAAAGADLVVVSGRGVDVYNPKTVRATAGALFHLPLVIEMDLEAALERLGRAGVKRWGASAAGGRPFTSADLREPSALVVGNESHGLPELPAGCLDGTLTIPMASGTESLNVAVAGSVLLFEAARQRGAGSHGSTGAGTGDDATARRPRSNTRGAA